MTRQTVGWILSMAATGCLGGLIGAHFAPTAVATGMPGERGAITTTGVTVVDDQGQPRAALLLWDGEHPGLFLRDERCERASLILADRDRAALALYGQDCRRRITLELQANDVPDFVLRDSDETPRARVHLLADGSPVMELLDAVGKPLKQLP